MNTRASQPARWVLAVLVTVASAALLYFIVGATDAALTVWQRLQRLPEWARWGFLGLIGLLVLATLWLAWRIAHPRKARAGKAEPIDRARLEQRMAALPEGDPTSTRLRQEFADAQTRAQSRQLYVALFGDISAGKSALMQALSGQATRSDVLGGTTREVRHAQVLLDDGLQLDLADVPGTNEVHGEEWGALAHGEAARAHALVYLSDGEPTRAQDAAIRRIGRFGKPLLLALNKADRYSHQELAQLIGRMRERYGDVAMDVLPVQAGGTERLAREDGSIIERDRAPRVDALMHALRVIANRGPQHYEAAREQSVLASVDAQLSRREVELRRERSAQCVRSWTRRAVIGALAAVAPGTDLLIQGALATGMLKELAGIHGLRMRDVDIDGVIDNAGNIVRTSASVTLAIAGNALKAFPGMGTLGGGLVHAVAYGLVFDSLGRAVAATLAQTRELDRQATLHAFEDQLKRPSAERIAVLIDIARDALRERNATP